MTDRYDEPWKDALDTYLRDFFHFFFPDIHNDIDWSRPAVGLEQELRPLTPDSEAEPKSDYRSVDKLVRVRAKNGEPVDVLVHIEVQAQPKKDFAERMYVYNYRAFDRFKKKTKEVVSLAVLADDSPSFHPTEYNPCSRWGCLSLLVFPTVKLRQYNERWQELEGSDNPFAVLVMVHLKAQATRHDTDERYKQRLELTERLYEKGYSEEKIHHFHRCLDWMMTLPEPLLERFEEHMLDIEEEKNMPYITSYERNGIKKGRLETSRSSVLAVCKARKLSLTERHRQRIEDCTDTDRLEAWLTQAVSAASADEIFAED